MNEDAATIATICATSFLADHGRTAPDRWNVATEATMADLEDRLVRGRSTRKAGFGLLVIFWWLRGPALPDLWSGSLAGLAGAVLVVWILSSLIWSAGWMISLRRAIPFAVAALAGTTMGFTVGLVRVVVIVVCSSSIFLLAGLANEAIRGTLLKRKGYRFAGTLHPNNQGLNCALLTLGILYLVSAEFWPREMLVCAVLVSGGLVLTRSRLAAGTTLLFALCLLAFVVNKSLYAGIYGLPGVLAVALIVAVAVVVLASSRRVSIREVVQRVLLLGRRRSGLVDLTGRVGLWRFVCSEIAAAPVLGHGYGAFWLPYRVQRAFEVTGWRFCDSHSAYLEVASGTGWIGLTLYVATLGTASSTACGVGGTIGIALGGFFCFVAVYGLLESAFVLASYFGVVFWMFMGALLAAS